MRRDTMTFYFDLYVDGELVSPNRIIEVDERYDMEKNGTLRYQKRPSTWQSMTATCAKAGYQRATSASK